LKTIKKTHDESIQNYVKHFCNARNAILYIHDIGIINAFRDRVSDIKTVEEIAMKKPRMVADMLAVANVCIKAFEARSRLLDSHGKGPLKKKQNGREVNTTDWGDHKDHRDHIYHLNHQQQSSDKKENRSFRQPNDAEKWCKIHCTSGHDLKECKTFLDRKKIPPPAAPVAQEPCRGEHRRANLDNDKQMGDINVIFEDSMSIASKTQGKKLEQVISLAQRIEPRRKMKWSNIDFSFGPEDHLEIELFRRNWPFVVNLPIRRHKVAKILIDNGALLNLILRKTFIEIGLNLKDFDPHT
jgi:hypothetical protein